MLPFEHLGPADRDSFTMGLWIQMTGNLAKLEGLDVVDRRSAAQYSAADKTLADIGSELGAQYVLTAFVRWAGDRVRISPQLARVDDGTVLWTDELERQIEAENLFSVQGEIAARVGQELNLSILGLEAAGNDAAPTSNTEAYNAYMRGLAVTARSNNEPPSSARSVRFCT